MATADATYGTRSLAGVWHRSPSPAPHDCRRRYQATCAVCGAKRVLCRATHAEVDRQLDRAWSCCIGIVS